MHKIALGAAAIAAGVIVVGQLEVGATDIESTGQSLEKTIAETLPAGTAPDVVLWEISGSGHWSDGTYQAYSIGTTSCNEGNANLEWNGGTNQHPVIGQSMYRVSDGRIYNIGQGWLKHGFCALDLNACGSCQGTGCGSLGIGCSDPYTASRNASQGNLGPKWQINATTGFFSYPPADPTWNGSTARRLRAHNDDVGTANHPDGRWFIEGMYMHPADAPASSGTPNPSNNASYREISLNTSGAWSGGYVGSTVQRAPGIAAWKAVHDDVTLTQHDIPGEGTFFLGHRVLDNGNGTWTYIYCLENLNSDRSAGTFSIPVSDSTTLTNVMFHDVDYHSGDGINNISQSGLDWAFSQSGGAAIWAGEDFSDNQNGNAIRWTTAFTFEFTADAPPSQLETLATVDYFKPGSPSSFTIATAGPELAPPLIGFAFPAGLPDLVDPSGDSITIQVQELEPGGLGGNTPMFHYDLGSGFVSTPMSPDGAAPGGSDLWIASVPSSDCGTIISYYFSAEQADGFERVSPFGAPANTYLTLSATSSVVAFDDDGESDPGWTVTNIDIVESAGQLQGPWDRGVPAGLGDRGDPTTDFDGSGSCWLTDNREGNSDVDGGPTQLMSPAVDLSAAGSAIVTYAWWFTNDDFDDALDVFISDDDGASWTPVHSWGAAAGWQQASFSVDDYVGLTSTVRIRIDATDNPNNSVTEGAVDAIEITAFSCGGSCPADLDGDDEVGFNDLVQLLATWGSCPGCPEDIDGDDLVGFNDIVELLTAWGPC